MARMADFEREAWAAVRGAEHTAAGWFGREDPYAAAEPDASPETPAETPTIEPAAHAAPDPQEDPMSVLTELENDAKALAAKFDTVDHDLLAKVEAIQGNGEAMNVLSELARLAGVPGLPAGVLNSAALLLQAVASV